MTADPCCALCRSSLGICLSKHSCQHHKDADKQDEANHRARQTYKNPTADRAIARADRARKKGRT